MRCPACGVAAAATDQTFCADCGTALPAPGTPADAIPAVAAMHVDPRGPLRSTPAVVATLGTVCVLVLGLALPFVRVEVSGNATDAIALQVNDIASNLIVALLAAAGLAVLGALLASTSRAWGRGLCVGGSVMLAGLLALVAGGGALVLDEQVVRWRTTAGTFLVVTTYGAGYFALACAGVGAAVSAALAVPGLRAEPTESRGAQGAIAVTARVLGGIGVCAMAVGLLLPGPGGRLLDNVTAREWPPAAVWTRLSFLGITLVLGAIGALVGRRWSWGVLAAVVAVGGWLHTTALFDLGDQPFGIGLGSVTPDPADPFTPHPLTSLGLAATVVAMALGTITSFRRHPTTPD